MNYEWLGVMAWVLGAGQLAAMVLIYYRHAIPRAPWFFRVAVLPGTVSGASIIVLGWLFLTGSDAAFGLTAITLAVIFLAGDAATWWALNLYAGYHYLFREASSTGYHMARADRERQDADEERLKADQERREADERREEQDRQRGA